MLSEYGPQARIIAAEQVTTGGLGGFFATRRFEITVELPDGPQEGVDAHELDLPTRLGLAALLDDADAAESGGFAGIDADDAGLYRPGPVRRTSAPFRPGSSSQASPLDAAAASENLSTASREFAQILDELHTVTELPVIPSPRPMPAAEPPLAAGVGDLLIVAGFAPDALAVARAMSFRLSADVVVAGAALAEGLVRIENRRDAITARARGVETERFVIVAFGLTPGEAVGAQAAQLAELRGDQLWLAVDSGRKAEDTARWVSALSASVTPDAVAGLGREATASPDSVKALGFPVSWAYDG